MLHLYFWLSTEGNLFLYESLISQLSFRWFNKTVLIRGSLNYLKYSIVIESENGRDPDEYTFSVYGSSCVDDDVRDDCTNPITRFFLVFFMKNWHLRLSVCLAFTWFSIIRCSEICSIRLWSDYSSSASENISNTRPDSIATITTLLHVPSNWNCSM